MAQYIYHCAWNVVFHFMGPLLHRTTGIPASMAAGDGSVGGSVVPMGTSISRSASRHQLANL